MLEGREHTPQPKHWWDVISMSRFEIATERKKIREFKKEKADEGWDDATQHYRVAETSSTGVLPAEKTKIASMINEPLFFQGEGVQIPVEYVVHYLNNLSDTEKKTIDAAQWGDSLESVEEQNKLLRENWMVMNPHPDDKGRIQVIKAISRRHGGTATSAGITMMIDEAALAHEMSLPADKQ